MSNHFSRPRHHLTTIRTVGAVVALTAALASCSSATPATGGASSPPPVSTTAPDEPASSTADPAPSSGATQPSSGGEATPEATPEPTAPESTPEPSPTTLRTDRCTSDHLTLTLSEGDGAAAGSRLPYLVVTNTGASGCTLQGWPGVSFVGDGDGAQIGAAADLDRSSTHATVTLAAGGSAHAPLKIAVAENYPADTCDPTTPDGLRVYPPGETHSLYVATTDYTACGAQDVVLMSVQAFQPGA